MPGKMPADRTILARTMSDGRDSELAGVFAELRRRSWVIALSALCAAIAAFGLSQVLDSRYDATADLLFQESNPNAPERAAATNLALASVDTVVFRVKRRLRSDLPIDDIRKWFALEPQGQADIVRVRARAGTPRRAAQLANVFAEEVVGMRRERAQQTVQRQIDAINGQITAAADNTKLVASLEQRRRELEVQKALATGDVEIADPATPPVRASSPRPLRYAAIAALLGLVLAIGAVLLLRAVQRRVSEKDVSDIFDAPILARVPTRRRGAWREQLYLEAFQFLRANVGIGIDPAAGNAGSSFRGRLVAVTSPLPGNGKSTVVAALADALAVNGSEVLAVDGDLRKPSLGLEFGLPQATAGLAEVLLGHGDARSFIVDTPVPNISLLPGGRIGADFAVAHATGQRVPELLEELRDLADIVIVDTAPVALAAETSIMTSVVDDVIVVVDARDLRRDALEDARDQLARARANVLGIVVNRAELNEDKSLKSAYGRAYRSSESSARGEQSLPPQTGTSAR
jgi:capsular exopolysaccharide synthesis family protein